MNEEGLFYLGWSEIASGGDTLVSSTEAEKPHAIVNLKQLILGFELHTPFIPINICTLGNAALG